jgi:hypothetical protein
MSTDGNYNKDEKERIMNQVCSALGDTKVPEPVLERAIHDPLYLHHLLLIKDSQSLLEKLIHEVMEALPTVSTGIRQPNIKEIANATQSILSAVAVPSLRTSDNDLKLRLDACYSCDNRVSAPNQGLYRVSKVVMGGDVCRLCGCHVETKARLARERCPAPDETNPGFNRWGQPIPNNNSA